MRRSLPSKQSIISLILFLSDLILSLAGYFIIFAYLTHLLIPHLARRLYNVKDLTIPIKNQALVWRSRSVIALTLTFSIIRLLLKWGKHVGCVLRWLGKWLGALLRWLLPFGMEPVANCPFCRSDAEDKTGEEKEEQLVVSLDQDSDGSSIGAFL